MGDRESVVVLKVGDWVLTSNNTVARIRLIQGGVVNGRYDSQKWYGVSEENPYRRHQLTLLPKELYPILSDSISILKGEEHGK